MRKYELSFDTKISESLKKCQATGQGSFKSAKLIICKTNTPWVLGAIRRQLLILTRSSHSAFGELNSTKGTFKCIGEGHGYSCITRHWKYKSGISELSYHLGVYYYCYGGVEEEVVANWSKFKYFIRYFITVDLNNRFKYKITLIFLLTSAFKSRAFLSLFDLSAVISFWS